MLLLLISRDDEFVRSPEGFGMSDKVGNSGPKRNGQNDDWGSGADDASSSGLPPDSKVCCGWTEAEITRNLCEELHCFVIVFSLKQTYQNADFHWNVDYVGQLGVPASIAICSFAFAITSSWLNSKINVRRLFEEQFWWELPCNKIVEGLSQINLWTRKDNWAWLYEKHSLHFYSHYTNGFLRREINFAQKNWDTKAVDEIYEIRSRYHRCTCALSKRPNTAILQSNYYVCALKRFTVKEKTKALDDEK